MSNTILYFHGFKSSSDSGKAQEFKKFIENYMNIKTEIVDNNPDILFFSVPSRKCPIEFVKENANIKLKIFFCGENTKNPRWKRYDDHYLNFADIALGFPDIIHNNYIRFPYWLTQINLENFNMGMVDLPFYKLDNLRRHFHKKKVCKPVLKDIPIEQLIEKYKVELLPATPSFLNMLLLGGHHKKADLSSLKIEIKDKLLEQLEKMKKETNANSVSINEKF